MALPLLALIDTGKITVLDIITHLPLIDTDKQEIYQRLLTLVWSDHSKILVLEEFIYGQFGGNHLVHPNIWELNNSPIFWKAAIRHQPVYATSELFKTIDQYQLDDIYQILDNYSKTTDPNILSIINEYYTSGVWNIHNGNNEKSEIIFFIQQNLDNSSVDETQYLTYDLIHSSHSRIMSTLNRIRDYRIDFPYRLYYDIAIKNKYANDVILGIFMLDNTYSLIKSANSLFFTICKHADHYKVWKEFITDTIKHSGLHANIVFKFSIYLFHKLCSSPLLDIFCKIYLDETLRLNKYYSTLLFIGNDNYININRIQFIQSLLHIYPHSIDMDIFKNRCVLLKKTNFATKNTIRQFKKIIHPITNSNYLSEPF
jgi:hypothetical protein